MYLGEECHTCSRDGAEDGQNNFCITTQSNPIKSTLERVLSTQEAAFCIKKDTASNVELFVSNPQNFPSKFLVS